MLQVAIYGRVLAADSGHLLLWGPLRPNGVLVVETFALGTLEPMEKGMVAETGVPWIAAAHPVGHLQIPEGLPAGRCDRLYPAQAGSTLDEVLLLAEGPTGSPTTTSVYSWCPRDGTVDVMPQPWFNSTAFDTTYQWITRVMRNRKNRHIFGDGIRIPPFELDADGAWLRRGGPPVPSA